MIPTADDERDLTRAGWRRMPLAAEIVFFVLTAVVVVAIYVLCWLWDLPKGWITAALAVGAAEWLIRRHRFWRTGIESALWIGGLVAFIVALPRSGRPESVLVLAAAAALAGWRMRNPVFGAAAAALVVAYPAAREWPAVALLSGVAIGLAAALATTHVWDRRSTTWLFGGLAVVAPMAGYFGARVPWVPRGLGSPSAAVIAILVVLAAIDLALGLRYRVRAPLLAGVVALALAVVEARDVVPLALEAELIVLGVITLVAAGLLLRGLRGRTTGIVVTRVERRELEEAAQTVTMLGMTAPGGRPHETGGPTPDRDCRFGGGGASDRY